MKQSAVEWFFSELERMQYFIGNDMLEAYKQAKEMEKQQIVEARVKKPLQSEWDEAEQYYNETFKNK
jgi:hypothetical protein